MTSDQLAPLPEDYTRLLESLKDRVRQTRLQAQRTVNAELIGLYWSIGRKILTRQDRQGWGTGVIRRLAEDLRAAFPEMTGFSQRNLQYMRSMAEAWGRRTKCATACGAIAVGTHPHHLGQSRIPSSPRLVLRCGAPIRVVPQRPAEHDDEPDHGAHRHGTVELQPRTGISGFGDGTTGSQRPLRIRFLGLAGEVAERDLEQALTDRIVETLRELGPGFAFVGRQVHFEVAGDDFHVDLLFFHVEQLRYFVIELKTGKFQPEHAGKLNFYVALVDDQLRRKAHASTVGILICGSKNEHTVRYALARTTSPMAVAAYTYEQLPAADQRLVPAEDQLTAALDSLPVTEE